RDVRVRIAFDAVKSPGFLGNRPTQRRRSPGDRVLIESVADGPASCFLERLGWIEIGHPLAEIDRGMAIGQARHLADDRFGEIVNAIGEHGPLLWTTNLPLATRSFLAKIISRSIFTMSPSARKGPTMRVPMTLAVLLGLSLAGSSLPADNPPGKGTRLFARGN